MPRRASGRFGGAVVHHATVHDLDRITHEGIPTTSVGRTLVDYAAVLTRPSLNNLVDAAFGRNLCGYQTTMDTWGRAGHVRGGESGSVGAARLLRRICEWGFPMPLCEYEVRDEHGQWVATVDFAWPAWRFVLEYDGEEGHGPRRRRLDARRQAAVERIGWTVERAHRFDNRPSSTRLFDLLKANLIEPPLTRTA